MSHSKPTHRASVNLGTKDKPRYREIGAAWPHQDGKGFNLSLDLIPTERSTIILRFIEARDEQAEEGGAR